MSDPTTTPKQLTVLEYEDLIGRQCALELLTSQSWAMLLRFLPDETRKLMVQEAMIALEARWGGFSPYAQIAAHQTADELLQAALFTAQECERIAPDTKPKKG